MLISHFAAQFEIGKCLKTFQIEKSYSFSYCSILKEMLQLVKTTLHMSRMQQGLVMQTFRVIMSYKASQPSDQLAYEIFSFIHDSIHKSPSCFIQTDLYGSKCQRKQERLFYKGLLNIKQEFLQADLRNHQLCTQRNY